MIKRRLTAERGKCHVEKPKNALRYNDAYRGRTSLFWCKKKSVGTAALLAAFALTLLKIPTWDEFPCRVRHQRWLYGRDGLGRTVCGRILLPIKLFCELLKHHKTTTRVCNSFRDTLLTERSLGGGGKSRFPPPPNDRWNIDPADALSHTKSKKTDWKK